MRGLDIQRKEIQIDDAARLPDVFSNISEDWIIFSKRFNCWKIVYHIILVTRTNPKSAMSLTI
jgi:hypothetical protein